MTVEHEGARPRSPIQRYFAGLAENTFQSQLGVVDPPMIDYLTDLLIRSVRTDVVHRVRSVNGKPLMSVPEMVAEAAARLGDAKRELHQHIGDFTLFWAGIYPEALRQSEDQSGKFETYCSFGKRSYRIASEIDAADETAPTATLLERLSIRFDLCCYGLREVRRQWESGGDEEFGPGSILLN
ncbi:MAG: hypothetical protein P8J27_02430 [Mariniblastus sp.]|nr:hypothetical protein [Mariniblastus sp.]